MYRNVFDVNRKRCEQASMHEVKAGIWPTNENILRNLIATLPTGMRRD